MSEERKLRMLLVEDEPLLIRALTRALKGTLEVVGAPDGDAARELIESQPFDAILSEVSIYDNQGMRFVDWLEKHAPQWLPRLILTSGGRDQSIALTFQNRHGCPLLHKPAESENIVDAVKHRLRALNKGSG